MFSKSMKSERRWSTLARAGGPEPTFIDEGTEGAIGAAGAAAGSSAGAGNGGLCRRAPPRRRREGFLSVSAASAAGNGTVSSIMSFLVVLSGA